MTLWCIFCILCVLSSVTSTDVSVTDDSPQVTLTYGPIKGLQFNSKWTNQMINAFRGIPYASPPTGDNRFKEAIQPQKWADVKDCTREGASCMQPADMFGAKVLGSTTPSIGMSEDCLYLNVYTPELQPKSLKPVVVWIHGGAFNAGSGNYSSYGPDFLVAEGVVVVTINYRLGSFGFLTLGTAEAPGNLGLKDQLLALKWVQNEIQNFGGDKDQVTLFGQSSGAACVHMHYLSPQSVGYFHRAIADSGAADVSWAARSDQVWYALQLAALVNCSTSNLTLTLSCLNDKTADEILDAQTKVPPKPEDDTEGITLRFIPTADSWSPTPFLPKLPEQLMKEKSGSMVPFMMGTLTDEGSIDILEFTEEQIKNTTMNLDKYIPVEVRDNLDDAELKAEEDKLNKFYLNDTQPSYSNLDGFLNLNTDAWFGYPTAVSARYYRDRSSVYLYYFTFNGKFKDPTTEYIDTQYNISIVAHAEELNYIFVNENVNQVADDGSNEMLMWRRMVRMWTNFIKFGVPTNGNDTLLQNVTWLPLDKDSTRHLHIDVDLTMNTSDYLADRMALWDSLASSSAAMFQLSFLAIVCFTLLFVL